MKDDLQIDREVDGFLETHRAAITDLVRKVGDEALTKLHCLHLWGSPRVAQNLRDLIRKTVRSKVEQGPCCQGAWESNDTFVVSIDSLAPMNQLRIRVALCLAETSIQRA